MINPLGKVMASNPPNMPLPKDGFLSWVDRQNGSLNKGENRVSMAFFPSAEGNWILTFKTSLFSGSGKYGGALVGSLDLSKSKFFDYLSEINLGDEGGIALYDENNHFIAGNGPPMRQGNNTRSQTSQRTLALEKQYIETNAKVKTTGWHLSAHYRREQLYGPLEHARHYFLFALLLTVILSGLVFWGSLRLLTQPLMDFVKYLEKARDHGQLPDLLAVNSKDEIGSLKIAFNGLLQKVKEQHLNLLTQLNFQKAFLQAIPIPVFSKDIEGHFLDCNEAFEKAVGKKKSWIIGRKSTDLFSNDDATRFVEKDSQVLTKQVPFHEEMPVMLNERVHHGLLSKALFRGNDNQVAGIVGAFLDITERKDTEKALNEAKTLAENLLSGAAIPFLVLDSEHRVVGWNQAMEALTGTSAGEMLGTKNQWQPFYRTSHPCLADLVLDNNWQNSENKFSHIRSHQEIPGALHGEGWYAQLNGQDRYLISNAAPIRNPQGDLVAVIESIEDQTELKRLEEQEAKNRLIAESQSRAIVAFLQSGDLSRMAQGFLKEVASTTEVSWGLLYLIDEPGGEAQILARQGTTSSKETTELFCTETASALDGRTDRISFRRDCLFFAPVVTRQTISELILCHTCLDRKDIPLGKGGILGLPLINGKEVIGGLLLLKPSGSFSDQDIHDIEMFCQAASLAIQSARMDQAREKAEQRLKVVEKFEAIGQLAGGIAHDFNNLLTVILGYTTLIAKKVDYDERLQQKANLVLQAGKSAEALIRQLLAFSRRQVLEAVVIDLNILIIDIKKLLHRLVAENIHLQFTLGTEACLIKADPSQVEQVLMNLLVNARDAIGEKNGHIRVSVEPAEIVTSLRDLPPEALGKSFVRLIIEDDGCGIPPETLSKIFDPFYTTKEIGRGTGLGLATVHGIVRQSGGYIDVQSILKQGTTFSVLLPAVEMDETFSTKTVISELIQTSGNLLLVDDLPEVLDLTSRILQEAGLTVTTAESGSAAMTIYEQMEDNLDLLVTDIGMPDINGIELAQRLREQQPELRVLYLSGYGQLHGQRDFVLKPGEAFLQKPFSAEVLLRKVVDLLVPHLNNQG
ncbi:ATP-binding protein [Geopsychrobacter electrodiphilus]|uniref:ATP-binding protein n=1 Tax=Geopsychrobacter electrodiphilus TaxID=225196 RepID=UPI00146D2191|nr:ATP-binding protein [Geopsychrobacter electrodiphilus]